MGKVRNLLLECKLLHSGWLCTYSQLSNYAKMREDTLARVPGVGMTIFIERIPSKCSRRSQILPGTSERRRRWPASSTCRRNSVSKLGSGFITLWYFTFWLAISKWVNKPGSTPQKHRATSVAKLPEPILLWKWLLPLYFLIQFLDPDWLIFCTI